MRTRQLEIIHSVYVHGTVSGAARALKVSQPSVSKTLRHAEDQLGVSLFQLARGRLVPTDEAHALMQEAADVFEQLESLKQTARNLANKGNAHIRIGTIPGLALDVLPRALARSRREWPSVTFEVHVNQHDDVSRSLIERETDIAIAFTPTPHPRLTSAFFASGELVALLPIDSPGSSAPRLPLEFLGGKDVVGVSATGPIVDVLTRAARDLGITYREPISVQTFFIAARLAQIEGSITIVDEFTARALVTPGFCWRPITPALGFTLSYLTLDNRQPSRAMHRFLRTIETVLHESR